MSKEARIAELAHSRSKESPPKGYRHIESFVEQDCGLFKGFQTNRFVTPWTQSGCNYNAEVMIVGQDWCSEKEIKRAIAKEDRCVFERGFSKRFPTNYNLAKLLCKHLGLERSDCWLTNVFPFIKGGSARLKIPIVELEKCAERFTLKEMDIIKPRLVICLGLDTYRAMRPVLGINGSPKRIGEAIQETQDTPRYFNSARIVCAAHTGVLGMRNRNKNDKNQVDKDWKRIAKYYKSYD